MILRSEWGIVLIPIIPSMFQHFNTGTWSVLNRILTPWLENAEKQKHEIIFPLCDTTSLLGIRSSCDGLCDLGTGHKWVHFLMSNGFWGVTSCKAYPFPCENNKSEKLLVLPFQATIYCKLFWIGIPSLMGETYHHYLILTKHIFSIVIHCCCWTDSFLNNKGVKIN